MTNIMESYTLQDHYKEIKEYVEGIDFENNEIKNSILSALDAKIGTGIVYQKDKIDGIHPVHYYCANCGQQLLYSNYIQKFPQGSMVKHAFHYRNCPSCGYAINYDDARKYEEEKEEK